MKGAVMWWAVLCTAGLAAACPLPTSALQQGEVQATWRVDGGPITVGRHFVLDVQLCPTTAVLQRVDAVMPEHRHGMNYRPSLKPLGNGHWRVEGLLFHMPGAWQLRLDVQLADRSEKLLDTILLP
jgi:hypothetical protein